MRSLNSLVQIDGRCFERIRRDCAGTPRFVSDIEDVDMAQALAQINQNQVALQAAFQVTSTLNRLSLLDYLPII